MGAYYVYCYSLLGEFKPFYIGKGKRCRARDHLERCKKKDGNSYNTFFYRKLRKLLRDGTPPDVYFIHKDLPEYLAFALEVVLIRMLGRRDIKTGPLCNLTDGGEGASNRSEESLKKTSEALRGRIKTPEEKLKISQALVGRKFTLEHRQKIQESALKRKQSEETKRKLRNLVVSEDTKRRISATRKCKPVESVSQEDITVTYKSISDAVLAGHQSACIDKCLAGRQPTHHGLTWRYQNA